MKRQVIRFAIDVPLVPPNVIDVQALLFDAQLLHNAERMHAGMLERGLSAKEAAKAAELVMLGAVEVVAELSDRGQC